MNPDPDALGGDYTGFEVAAHALEPNAELIRKSLLDPADEEADITAFDRANGARIELRPRSLRLGTGDLIGVHTWINLFEDFEGASAYLEDYIQDISKGVGGGVPSDLIVTGVDSFAVEDLGQESVGLILGESRLGGELVRFQTLIGFRIGRLLAFVALIHPDDSDHRVRAIRLAEALERRVDGVLTGNLVPAEPEPQPQPLLAYEFAYAQTVARRGSEGTITSEGIEILPDQLSCQIKTDLAGIEQTRAYVVMGDRAWAADADAQDPSYQTVSPDEYLVAGDLLYCPGWPVELAASGLDLALAGRPLTEFELDDGTPALFYQLDEAAATDIGLVPDGSPIEVDRFEVTADAISPWVRSLDIEMSGSASAFADAFGSAFVQFGGGRTTVTISFEAKRINDPDLEVTPPA